MIEDYGIINDRSPHIIADLCEIICYFENVDVSRGDIESFIANRGGDGLFRELDSGNKDSAEANAKLQLLAEEAMLHIAYRQTAFGTWYPFSISEDVITLHPHITQQHKIYAALLAYSRLKMFTAQDRTHFAAAFEKVCKVATPGLFPQWRIYHFSPGGEDRKLFGVKLKDALRELGKKTKDIVVDKHINELSENNTGDGGIDIIALYEWSDEAPGLPTYFGQCAAQQEGWPEKKFEAHGGNLERYFNFFHKPGSMLFIPVCYHGLNGDWIDSVGHQVVLVDRLRLVKLLETVESVGNASGSGSIQTTINVPFEPGCASPAAA